MTVLAEMCLYIVKLCNARKLTFLSILATKELWDVRGLKFGIFIPIRSASLANFIEV
jgi:hypothetical protein